MAEDFVSFGISVLSIVIPVVIAAIIILVTAWIIFRWRHSSDNKSHSAA
jgi:hypothetical protein